MDDGSVYPPVPVFNETPPPEQPNMKVEECATSPPDVVSIVCSMTRRPEILTSSRCILPTPASIRPPASTTLLAFQPRTQ